MNTDIRTPLLAQSQYTEDLQAGRCHPRKARKTNQSLFSKMIDRFKRYYFTESSPNHPDHPKQVKGRKAKAINTPKASRVVNPKQPDRWGVSWAMYDGKIVKY